MSKEISAVAYEATRQVNCNAWTALAMVREAVEMYAPPGALPSDEHTGLSILQEGEALAQAIATIAAQPRA